MHPVGEIKSAASYCSAMTVHFYFLPVPIFDSVNVMVFIIIILIPYSFAKHLNNKQECQNINLLFWQKLQQRKLVQNKLNPFFHRISLSFQGPSGMTYGLGVSLFMSSA